MGRVPCLSAGSQSGSIGTFVDCFRSFCGSNSNSDPTTGSSRNNSNTSCSSGNNGSSSHSSSSNNSSSNRAGTFSVV